MGMFGGAAKAGNQWSQLASFFPEDSAAGQGVKGWSGLDTTGKTGGIDIASILAGIGSMGGQQQAPPAPPPPQWMPPPQPQFRDMLNAPRLASQQMMPTPQYMAPYMWGQR